MPEHVLRVIAVLEIGTFEGRSAEWMLDNLLTHPESTLTVIDTFAGSFEQFYQSVAVDTIETRFDANLARFGSKVIVTVLAAVCLPLSRVRAVRCRGVCQVRKLKGDSRALLRTFPRQQTFDLVYIDGEHHAASVLEDAVLAFPLLKVGGAMVFDDFGGGGPDGGNKYPRQGVQAFVTAYLDRLQELHVGWQVHLRKVSDGCNIPDCPCKTGGSH